MPAYDLAVALQELAAGRAPVWTKQEGYAFDKSPTSAGVGVLLNSALSTKFVARLRETSGVRTARFTFTPDNLQTYGLTFDGTGITFVSDATATAEEIAEGLRSAIALDVTLSTFLVPSIDPDDPLNETLKVVGIDGRHWEIDAITATGAGATHCTADAWGGEAWHFLMPQGEPAVGGGSTPFGGWDLPINEADPAGGGPDQVDGHLFTFGGWTDALLTAGYARLYMRVDNVVGSVNDGAVLANATLEYRKPDVWIGPCRRESTVPGEA